MKYAGFSIRKGIANSNKVDWKPIAQVAAAFIGIIGVTALISAIIKSK